MISRRESIELTVEILLDHHTIQIIRRLTGRASGMTIIVEMTPIVKIFIDQIHTTLSHETEVIQWTRKSSVCTTINMPINMHQNNEQSQI